MPPLIQLDQIALTFGGTPLLTGASLALDPGERIALVGRNGSGKSTLLKIAAGVVEPDKGEVFRQPTATIQVLPQEPDFSGYKTTLDYVEKGLSPLQDNYIALNFLYELGLTGEENPLTLSGGEARRAALARVLACEPDILILDEPTNHLDLPLIEWLENHLKSIKSAQILISHDRRFLTNLTQKVVWLDRGETKTLNQGFEFFEGWRDKVLEEEELERHKLNRKIVDEEHWLRYGVSARRKRNVKRLGDLYSLRDKAKDWRGPQGNVKLEASESEQSGKLVLEAKGVNLSYDRPIVKDFTIRIERGERIGLVGANGAGKTTLLNLLTKQSEPDSGFVRHGVHLDLVTLDQKRETLDPQMSLKEALTEGRSDQVMVNGEPRHVMSYLKDFLFTPEQAGTALIKLSGGERGRLMLARALAKPSNFLILDEPTNDLDLETLDLLQEMIADYQGTVILVSHDRDFLDKTVNKVIFAEGNGAWTVYAGGYTDMLSQRGEGVRAAKREAKQAEKVVVTSSRVKNTAKKLSFKQKHALETLPSEIKTLERDISILNAKLGDSNLFTKNRSQFDRFSADLTDRQNRLSKANDEWLELEMLREEIEASGN
jgi:ABC transport system ATP-binding/permease protein